MTGSALFDSVQRIARHEVAAKAVAAVGSVAETHPADTVADHAVTVELRDSGLVLPRVPIAVGVMGFAAIPAVGDLVLVVFAEGDVNAPVVVGRLYHPGQDPPAHGDGEIVLRLPSGGQPKLDLVIDGAAPSLELKLPGDVALDLSEGTVSITVGQLHISAEQAGGGRVEVAAGSSQIVLKQDGDVTVSAAGKLTLEGAEVEINGSSRVKMAGAMVEIN